MTDTPQAPRIGALDRTAFVATYGELFEHSPWVAERAWRPEGYESADRMLEAMAAVLAAASDEERLGLLRAHPELAGREAESGELTAFSADEQASAGLNRLSRDEFVAVQGWNAAYRARHGFPFIACVRHYTKTGLLAELKRRSERDTGRELEEALAQVGFIARARLERLG